MLTVDVAVVVVAYNSGAQLERCLTSVARSAERADLKLFSVVVDNHEKSLDVWVKESCDHYIARPDNPGFGVGNNEGLKYLLREVSFQRVLLLNPDAWVDQEFMPNLARILGVSGAPDVIAPIAYLPDLVPAVRLNDLIPQRVSTRSFVVHSCGSRVEIHDALGKRTYSGFAHFTPVTAESWIAWPSGEVPSHIRVFHRSTGDLVGEFDTEHLKQTASDYRVILNAGSFVEGPAGAGDIAHMHIDTGHYSSESVDVAAWCGGAVLLSRRFLETVGLFSPTYFLYYEDVDLALRGLRAEFLTRVDPSLVVFHELSSSTGVNHMRRNRWITRSRGVFAARSFGRTVAISRLLLRMGRVLRDKSVGGVPTGEQSPGGFLRLELRGALAGALSRKRCNADA